MPIDLIEEPSTKLLTVRMSGKLTNEDYEKFVPEAERIFQKLGKLNIFVHMQNFHGWEAKAAWEDFKFGMRHNADIQRIALVGDKKWEQWMAALCKPFMKAEVRYFDLAKEQEARAWIAGT